MKIKSILHSEVSGSIGTLAGAGGSGGSHLRTKILTNKTVSTQRSLSNARMKEANIAWQDMTLEARADWERYGKTLTRINATGHTTKKTGWGAFSGAYNLMKQVGKDTSPILLNAPQKEGYEDEAKVQIYTRGNEWTVKVLDQKTMGVATWVSPEFKNTINTNKFNYKFYIYFDTTWPAPFSIPFFVGDYNFFLKIRVINADGSMSKSRLYKTYATP